MLHRVLHFIAPISLMAMTCFGCSSDFSTTSKAKLIIEMLGESLAPEGAAGTEDPQYEEFTLIGCRFAADGEETGSTVIFDGTGAKAVKIVNREQIILEKDIAAYVDKTYQSLELSFEKSAQGVSKSNKSPVTFTLAEANPELTEAFTVKTAKELNLKVRVHWRNTAAQGTISAPTLALSFD